MLIESRSEFIDDKLVLFDFEVAKHLRFLFLALVSEPLRNFGDQDLNAAQRVFHDRAFLR